MPDKAPGETPESPVPPAGDAHEEFCFEEMPDEAAAAQFADRALIRTLCNFIGMSLEATQPDGRRVRLARDMAITAAYDRIRRICNDDQPIDPEFTDAPADYLGEEDGPCD